ncbi:MAG: hypothetical protein IKE75_05365 [Bacilli bacterium]|nr:hypothetical protein [Bacilli bacterium]
MPSWSIHLSIANEVKKKLKLTDEFIVGNIMPDILVGYMVENPSIIIDKNTSHFSDGKPPTINIDKFIKKYKKNLNHPLVQGYLSHLIADSFYNEYTYKHHYSFEDGRPKAILKDGTKLSAFVHKPWKIKQHDFEIYSQKLIDNNFIPIINENKLNYSNIIKECPIDKGDLEKAICIIEKIRNSKKEYCKDELIMFTEYELDLLYDKCCDEVYKKLKDI